MSSAWSGEDVGPMFGASRRLRHAPWGEDIQPTFPRPLFAKMRDKGITLEQLRELGSFAKRLCKAGLLKYPLTKTNDELGRTFSIIKWAEITQHELTSEIIKQIIPKADSCSWVELVAQDGPQPCKYFCSHNWAEYFRDFLNTVELHAIENGVTPGETYWICVYANDQHSVSLGDTLFESPFYDALKGSVSTVFFIDKAATALSRLWCAFELNETLALGHKLELWTPFGVVGSARVSSGNMVQAVHNLDLKTADASDEVDKRRILNHLAGISELTGICVTEASAGPKKQLDPAHPKGEYEREVIATHAPQIDALSKQIREGALGETKPKHGFRQEPFWIKDSARRGIRMSQFRELMQRLKVEFDRKEFYRKERCEEERVYYKTCDVYDLVDCFVLPWTEPYECSLIELIAEGPQDLDYFMQIWWKHTIVEMLASLEWHVEALRLPDTVTYWFGAFANNQRKLGDTVIKNVENVEDAAFARALRSHTCKGTLVILEKSGTMLRRSWSSLEAHMAMNYRKSVDLACSSGVVATTRPFADGMWEFGNFDPPDGAVDFDVRQTECARRADYTLVLGTILGTREHLSPTNRHVHRHVHHPRIDMFNARYRSCAAGPLLRKAAFEGDLDVIREVSTACPGLRFDALRLRGDNGEAPLHVGAAAGHCAAVELLLSLKADPDLQDSAGETALHYAALAGQAETVRLLLKQRADPNMESFNSATPLDVAKQNLAYFLSVDTREVVRLLQGVTMSWRREYGSSV